MIPGAGSGAGSRVPPGWCMGRAHLGFPLRLGILSLCYGNLLRAKQAAGWELKAAAPNCKPVF